VSSAILVTGAAGFIGSHVIDVLLQRGERVVGVDNLSRGTLEGLSTACNHERFRFVQADLSERSSFQVLESSGPYHEVWHLAANSDILAGTKDPSVDHRDTFLTTFNTLLFMRQTGVRNLVFASTSAVYGNMDKLLTEDIGPLFPISSYGAMKLASEASISAAVESFLEHAWILRFPNVIGPRATHGIIYDLLGKLAARPAAMEVLGDGKQQKPYLHVAELVEAMFFIRDKSNAALNYYNIGPADTGVTVRSIAEAVIRCAAPDVPIHYTGGAKGWTGDVPKFAYSVEKLRSLGWSAKLSSAQAVERAVAEIHAEFTASCKS
jgi:UDP-glucose 4-epimerase